MIVSLDASYRDCQRQTRRTARNFYYSFLVLPRAERRAMYALYAFLRHTDDLGDSDAPIADRRKALHAWRVSLDRSLAGEFDSPLLPALADTLRRYRVPLVYLHDVIDGVLMDLDDRVYETFGQLCEYCRRVASAVGLACIHIWGFTDEAPALEAADCSGIAFQITNILRDLKEDVAVGRVYLPQEDLKRFNYSADDIRAGVRDDRFQQLMRFEIKRAEEFYHRGAELRRYLHADGRAAFGAMTTIYHGLLEEIVRRDCDVYTTRVRLTRSRKLRIVAHWFAIKYLPFGRHRS